MARMWGRRDRDTREWDFGARLWLLVSAQKDEMQTLSAPTPQPEPAEVRRHSGTAASSCPASCLGKSRFLESSGSRLSWQCLLRAPAPCPELLCGLILGLGGTEGPQPPFCCCCHAGNLPQSCPGM